MMKGNTKIIEIFSDNFFNFIFFIITSPRGHDIVLSLYSLNLLNEFFLPKTYSVAVKHTFTTAIGKTNVIDTTFYR
jgi:hypothetical protein